MADRLTPDGHDIVTTHVYPPISRRDWDWCASIDGEEEFGPLGWGTTESEAVADLLQRIGS